MVATANAVATIGWFGERMNEILIVLLCFSGIFTFAFGLAWALPLFTAGMEERNKEVELKPRTRDFADILLVLNDMLPVFLIFDIFRQAPEDYSAAKRKWKEDSMVRVSFWIFLSSGITCIALITQLF